MKKIVFRMTALMAAMMMTLARFCLCAGCNDGYGRRVQDCDGCQ